MPSVKSYQNRKKEVEKLKVELAKAHNVAENDAALYLEEKKNNAVAYSQLQHENRILKTQLSVSKIMTSITSQAENQVIDALHNKVIELERKVRIYRDYIRHGEACYPEHHTQTINIPACLKPLDALEYIGKKIEEPMIYPPVNPTDEDYQPGDNPTWSQIKNGPDNLS